MKAAGTTIAPNFFLLGAHKGGTTSLYFYLQQHPHVAMSHVKEPNFLSPLVQRGFRVSSAVGAEKRFTYEQYLELFAGTADAAVRGEASTVYLYDPEAPASIVKAFPGARAAVVLRHPAERAYSNFTFARRDGKEPIASFEGALAAEDERVAAGWATLWHYRRKGFYGEQLMRAFDAFGEDRVHVIFYEDFRRDAAGTVQGLFRFLGVDDTFVPSMETSHNQSGAPRSELIHSLTNRPNLLKNALKRMLPPRLRVALTARLLTRVRNANLARPEPLAPEVRARLTQDYRTDILKLQDLTGRDLSHWLAGE